MNIVEFLNIAGFQKEKQEEEHRQIKEMNKKYG